MKKIYLYLASLVCLAAVGMTSCSDNSDFYKEHNLTDEEIAELAYQDSLKQAQLASINADLILEYSVTFTASASSYDGTQLYIPTEDLQQIADLFGISSVTQLVQMIWDYDITPFAIEGSTHQDNMTASTSSSYWGHWWTPDGDVTDWASNSYIYTEFWFDDEDTYEDPYFECGQYPGLVSAGDVYTVIEALTYNDKRVALVITFNIEALADVTATVVATQQLSMNMPVNTTYKTYPVQFDMDKTLSDLGISSMDEVKFVAVDAEGNYVQEYSADPYGFYYDQQGYPGYWGDDASLFVVYYYGDGEDYDCFSVGQMPGGTNVGDTFTVKIGALANDKIEMFEITATIGEMEYITGTIVNTIEMDVTIPLDTEWTFEEAPLQFDLDQVLSDLGVSSADEITALGVVEDGKYTDDYTVDPTGFWHNPEGYVVDYGDGSVLYSCWPGDFYDEDADDWLQIGDDYMGIGQYSDNVADGETYLLQFGFMNDNNEIVLLKINVTTAAE